MLSQVDVWHRACLGPLGLPYFVLASLGLVLQAVAWTMILRTNNVPSRRPLLVASAGAALTILGMASCREAIRLTTLGEETVATLCPKHAKASEMSGLVVSL